jgi:hypothetical protein
MYTMQQGKLDCAKLLIAEDPQVLLAESRELRRLTLKDCIYCLAWFLVSAAAFLLRLAYFFTEDGCATKGNYSKDWDERPSFGGELYRPFE